MTEQATHPLWKTRAGRNAAKACARARHDDPMEVLRLFYALEYAPADLLPLARGEAIDANELRGRLAVARREAGRVEHFTLSMIGY